MAKKSEKGKKRENDGSDGVMELVISLSLFLSLSLSLSHFQVGGGKGETSHTSVQQSSAVVAD